MPTTATTSHRRPCKVILTSRKRASVRCSHHKCERRVYFDAQPLAIRCGYCLQVYCRSHALKHFGVENIDRQAKQIAKIIRRFLEPKTEKAPK